MTSVLLLSDNLATGGARLAEAVIKSWSAEATLYFTHSNNLNLPDSLPENVIPIYLTKRNPIPRSLRRLWILFKFRVFIVMNFTNFALPLKLLPSRRRKIFDEILLIHNPYLVAEPMYMGIPADFKFSTYQKIKKIVFFICSLLSEPRIIMHQTNWMKTRIQVTAPSLKPRFWYLIPPYLQCVPDRIVRGSEFSYSILSRNPDLKPANTWFYPSAIYPHKNHSRLLEIARNIQKSNGNQRIVITANENEPLANELLESIRKGCLDRIIHNLGWLTHAETLATLELCKGMLFLSTFETLGLPLLEAKRLSKPIIAAELETSRELVGDYAVFVDLSDPFYSAKIVNRMKTVEDWFTPPSDSENVVVGSVYEEYAKKPLEFLGKTRSGGSISV